MATRVARKASPDVAGVQNQLEELPGTYAKADDLQALQQQASMSSVAAQKTSSEVAAVQQQLQSLPGKYATAVDVRALQQQVKDDCIKRPELQKVIGERDNKLQQLADYLNKLPSQDRLSEQLPALQNAIDGCVAATVDQQGQIDILRAFNACSSEMIVMDNDVYNWVRAVLPEPARRRYFDSQPMGEGQPEEPATNEADRILAEYEASQQGNAPTLWSTMQSTFL